MDKSAIKRFASEARSQLIEQVKQKAFAIGITASKIEEFKTVDLYGSAFKQQRDQLISLIKATSFESVMEDMADVWFVRFIALRFLEVNGFMPTGTQVLSSADPDLILAQCNALHSILPFMFQKPQDYSELLFPTNLMDMLTSIPEDHWQEVEILGWLYQSYVSEKKDKIFAGLRQNGKIAKADIPAATQLFTPKWIVQYMVENSVGRLWLEAHLDSKLANNWRYYLTPLEQEPDVQATLDELRNSDLKPEDITVMDPACGSGHILVYAFDVLYEIYQERGYLTSNIPELILKNNLFGLEIDDRVAQLARFALLMKACSKSPSILAKGVVPNIVSIQETNRLNESSWYAALNGKTKRIVDQLIDTYKDAKNYGSILRSQLFSLDEAKSVLADLKNTVDDGAGLLRLEELIKQTELLTKKYDVVITNPPYMGNRTMNGDLNNFLRKNYPDAKSDLFAAFLERTLEMTKVGGATATINQHSWMFLSSYERLRLKLLNTQSLQSLLHLGPHAFDEIGGEVVQSVAFVTRNISCPRFKGEFHRLIEPKSSEEKRELMLAARHSYIQSGQDFYAIPGFPLAYWASAGVRRAFEEKPLAEVARPRQGIATADNKRFLRLWYEVNIKNVGLSLADSNEARISKAKWFPYNKGGEFRKWYGNQDYVINWQDDGAEIKAFSRSIIRNPSFYFREGITWSFVGSSRFGARYTPPGFIFDVGGSSLFPCKDDLFYIVGFLCSKIAHEFLSYMNPTLNFQVGNIATLPIRISDEHRDSVESLVRHNIQISKTDWDSLETSWNFKRHPLLVHQDGGLIEDAFRRWDNFAQEQFQQLKANEEELNRIFIEIYGLENELVPKITDEAVTIRRADRLRDVKSFVSFAVGCMFGRYSLDEEGLVYAGGDFDLGKYQTFEVTEDNIIPIIDEHYFPYDIVSRFVDFVEVVFGPENLEANLEFIADSIMTRRVTETAREAIRRYFRCHFYKDHVQLYKKRPIYWLFTSSCGTFSALIYMHRYDPSTLKRIHTDYLLALQNKLIAEEGSGVSQKRQDIDQQLAELRNYCNLIQHLEEETIEIDLDDGVVVNYEKLAAVLAKI